MSAETQRLDKWLWHARFFKSRSLATKLVQTGKVRVNSVPVSKPSRTVTSGDVLTFPKEQDVRVIKVLSLPERRGPAPEAQASYDDLDPPKPKARSAPNPRADERPSGRDLKAMRKFKQSLEDHN